MFKKTILFSLAILAFLLAKQAVLGSIHKILIRLCYVRVNFEESNPFSNNSPTCFLFEDLGVSLKPTNANSMLDVPYRNQT